MRCYIPSLRDSDNSNDTTAVEFELLGDEQVEITLENPMRVVVVRLKELRAVVNALRDAQD